MRSVFSSSSRLSDISWRAGRSPRSAGGSLAPSCGSHGFDFRLPVAMAGAGV
jgi:hypothetical protein